MTIFTVILTILLVASVTSISARRNPTAIPDCPACWCKSAGDCPDPKYACPPVNNCKTAVVKDRCGCCDVCLKDIGEACRREPLEKQDAMCDKGLSCRPSDDAWYCENMEPSNVKVSRCEKENKNRCYDLLTHKFYRPGEIWVRGDFTCTACTCKRNGQLNCWGITCNDPGCKHTTREEGRCCRVCLDTDAKKVCRYNGKKHFQNEIIALEDHRSICKCVESEGWVCQHDDKNPMISLNERPRCADALTDEMYKKGDIWSLSECAHCLCGDFQTGNCSSFSCPRPLCDDPFKMKGRCCLVCPKDYAKVCHFEGVKYFHGELLVLLDRCTLCSCRNSYWQCSSDRCKFTKMIKEPLKMTPK